MSINTSYSPQVIPLYWFNPIDKLRFYLLLLYDDVTRNYISVEFSVHVPIFMFLLWSLSRRKKKSKEREKKKDFLRSGFLSSPIFPFSALFPVWNIKRLKRCERIFSFFWDSKIMETEKKRDQNCDTESWFCTVIPPILFPFLLTFFVVILLLGICGPLSRKIHPLFYLDFLKY